MARQPRPDFTYSSSTVGGGECVRFGTNFHERTVVPTDAVLLDACMCCGCLGMWMGCGLAPMFRSFAHVSVTIRPTADGFLEVRIISESTYDLAYVCYMCRYEPVGAADVDGFVCTKYEVCYLLFSIPNISLF